MYYCCYVYFTSVSETPPRRYINMFIFIIIFLKSVILLNVMAFKYFCISKMLFRIKCTFIN